MFAEDLDLYLADFSSLAEFGTQRAEVILNKQDADILGDRVQSTSYVMRYKASDLVGLGHGDPVVVDGVDYSVIAVSAISDGAFMNATLQRTATPL